MMEVNITVQINGVTL